MMTWRVRRCARSRRTRTRATVRDRARMWVMVVVEKASAICQCSATGADGLPGPRDAFTPSAPGPAGHGKERRDVLRGLAVVHAVVRFRHVADVRRGNHVRQASGKATTPAAARRRTRQPAPATLPPCERLDERRLVDNRPARRVDQIARRASWAPQVVRRRSGRGCARAELGGGPSHEVVVCGTARPCRPGATPVLLGRALGEVLAPRHARSCPNAQPDARHAACRALPRPDHPERRPVQVGAHPALPAARCARARVSGRPPARSARISAHRQLGGGVPDGSRCRTP